MIAFIDDHRGAHGPRGARRGARLVWFDPIKVPDLRAVLEQAFGELALFEVLPVPEPEFAPAPSHPDRRLPSWRIRRARCGLCG